MQASPNPVPGESGAPCKAPWAPRNHSVGAQRLPWKSRVLHRKKSLLGANFLCWIWNGLPKATLGRQCSKLRVHSAPGAHISAAGRTFFGHVRPMCAHFFTQFSLQYTRGVHRKIPGRTVLIWMHPRGAQNKTLVSNTGTVWEGGPPPRKIWRNQECSGAFWWVLITWIRYTYDVSSPQKNKPKRVS